jgi:hypothetical protein
MTAPVEQIAEKPFDVCRCGDFRHQHVNGTGRCKLGDLCFPGRCQKFRLSDTEAEYAARYPEHYSAVRDYLRSKS